MGGIAIAAERRQFGSFYRGRAIVASDPDATAAKLRAAAAMLHNSAMVENEFLPEPLVANPLPLFAQWYEVAHRARLQPNPNAMVIATVDAQGRPSARVVLCKHLVVDPGYLVFFTNYESQKGSDLAAHPYTAAVFHWDALHRQVRIAGPVTKSPRAETDAYFKTRPLGNRIGAWASEQSRPLASRAQLARRVADTEQRFGIRPGDVEGDVPAPPHWGGFRIWVQSIELWIEGPGRVHDRALWQRELTADDQTYAVGPWTATRLNP